MVIKSFFIFLGVMGLSFQVFGEGNKPVPTSPSKVITQPTAKKSKPPAPMTFEACCEEQFGDSDACHALSHVTQKMKNNAKKECFEDAMEDAIDID